jgi:hypothetical protein
LQKKKEICEDFLCLEKMLPCRIDRTVIGVCFFASLRWLNNVSGVYLVQVSLLHIGQWGLGHFFRYRPLPLIGWRIVQVQYKQQANPLFVNSRNDKNKQLTLLSQRKLALTARNTHFAL